MTARTRLPAELEAVAADVFEQLRSSGEWPQLAPFRSRFRADGRHLEGILAEAGEFFDIIDGDGANARIRVSLAAAIQLPRASEWLSPLVDLTKEALTRYEQAWARPEATEPPRMSMDEVAALWPDADEAMGVTRLLFSGHRSPPLGIQWQSLSPERRTLEGRPVADVLLHRHTSTLEDLVAKRQPTVRHSRIPSPECRNLLEVVRSHFLEHSRWPRYDHLCVRAADLGFVPSLLTALKSRAYIAYDYDSETGCFGQVRVTFDGWKWIAKADELSDFLHLFETLHSLYVKHPDISEFSYDWLLREAGLEKPPCQLLVELLASESWLGSHLERSSPPSFRPSGEVLLSARKVSHWIEFEQFRFENLPESTVNSDDSYPPLEAFSGLTREQFDQEKKLAHCIAVLRIAESYFARQRPKNFQHMSDLVAEVEAMCHSVLERLGTSLEERLAREKYDRVREGIAEGNRRGWGNQSQSSVQSQLQQMADMLQEPRSKILTGLAWLAEFCARFSRWPTDGEIPVHLQLPIRDGEHFPELVLQPAGIIPRARALTTLGATLIGGLDSHLESTTKVARYLSTLSQDAVPLRHVISHLSLGGATGISRILAGEPFGIYREGTDWSDPKDPTLVLSSRIRKLSSTISSSSLAQALHPATWDELARMGLLHLSNAPEESRTKAKARSKTLGAWTLGRTLGKPSGQGRVYEARKTALETVHALKEVRLHTEKKRHRFINEVRQMMRFTEQRARHIVPIVDENLVDVEKGASTGFYVMPMAASTLDAMLPKVRGQVELCLKIGEGILKGLAAAHANGVVHRDVKPPNVLFLDDTFDLPCLADFGICLVADDDATRPTSVDEFVGPFYFRAPEQELPGQGPITPAADLYSFGKILHNMLTGRRTIRREELESAFSEEELRDRRIRRLLDEVLQNVIVAEPAERLQDAGVVQELIEKIRRGEDSGRGPIAPVGTLRREFASTIADLDADRSRSVIVRFRQARSAFLASHGRSVDSQREAFLRFLWSSTSLLGPVLAAGQLDETSLIPDIKKTIEEILADGTQRPRPQPFGCLAGLLYFSACFSGYAAGSWKLLRALLDGEFEYYHHSGRPLRCHGFDSSAMMAASSMPKTTASQQTLMSCVLGEPGVCELLGISDGFDSVFEQTGFLLALRAAKAHEVGRGSTMLWEFQRGFGVLEPMLDRVYGDPDFRSGLSVSFGEEPESWLQKLPDRLGRVAKQLQNTNWLLARDLREYKPREHLMR